MRADLFLVDLGFASSRNRAQELIASGTVFIVSDKSRQAVKKSSAQIELKDGERIEISGGADPLLYVSRGGLKMRGAIEHTRIKVAGAHVLDVGISTGGFTDCLLQSGAAQVVGVDVGHGQLHDKIARDPRVKHFEGINARDLTKLDFFALTAGSPTAPKFDLIVVDLSFISLTLVLPSAIQYLKESGAVLALVKPQFEVGRDGLGKNGIVKDVGLFEAVEKKIRKACEISGLIVEDYFASSIEGSDGNKEFFILARSPEIAFDLFKPSGGDGSDRRLSGM